MTNKTHFIKAPCHQSNRDQGYQFAPDEIKQNYDHEIDIKSFTGTQISPDNIKICEGYNELYDHIVNYNHGSNDKIVTIGGDFSICAATVPALNERYNSKLKVICVSPYHHMNTFDDLENLTGLDEVAMSSAIGNLNPSLVKSISKNLFTCQQLVYLGIDSNKNDLEILDHYEIPYFTQDKIEQIGVDKICEIVKMYTIDDYNVHLCINMETPKEYINQIVNSFKEQMVSMDITEFNPCIKDSVFEKKECIKEILMHAFDIKEKTINIFNEDSEFLIYRPIAQENPETDIGWYILRGLNLDQKKDIISKLDSERTTAIDIDGEDYLITTTSMNEQNGKSYFTAQSIQDFTLLPNEKLLMCFELVNSSS